MNDKHYILVAFLDWGLGHATRCMPIIDTLLAKQYAVILAGNGKSLQFMQQQYPNLKTYELPDYNIQYDANKHAAWQILWQSTKIYDAINKEYECVKNIVAQENIQTIISDNRYGVHHEKCKNIFVSHQIAIQAPKPFKFVEPFLLNRLLKLIHKFDELWIPDIEEIEISLTGKLSHNFSTKISKKYIGILSRFTKNIHSSYYDDEKFDVVAIISGVEPQRTHFEATLLEKLKQTNKKCLLICGRVESKMTKIVDDNVTIINFLHSDALMYYLQQAKVIVCRSGYSTIMDLVALNKKAILIPTPGQTEQEYLAKMLSEKKMTIMQTQDKIDLVLALQQTESIQGFSNVYTKDLSKEISLH